MSPETRRACWDVLGASLVLLSAWILVIYAIPDYLGAELTTPDGKVLTTESGAALTIPEDYAQLDAYLFYAVPAMVLATVGTAIQVRGALAVLLRVMRLRRF